MSAKKSKFQSDFSFDGNRVVSRERSKLRRDQNGNVPSNLLAEAPLPTSKIKTELNVSQSAHQKSMHCDPPRDENLMNIMRKKASSAAGQQNR